MEDRSYSTLSRHGLASSYSYLDGVPFKIGPSFKQPSKFVPPPELAVSYASTLLQEEYSFETEEAVLAWARAREEALKQAAVEQAEKLKQAEELAKAAESQHETNGEGPESERAQHLNYDVPRSSLTQDSHVNQQPKPPVPPKPVNKPMNEPGTILKPTPIHPTVSASAVKQADDSKTNKSLISTSIDVSMFESEADPFDNLELQTINDMEELKVLLDSSSSKPSTSVTQTQVKSNQTHSGVADKEIASAAKSGDGDTDDIYEMAAVVKENAWETFSDENDDAMSAKDSSQSLAVCNSSSTEVIRDNTEDGDYVEISSDCQKQTVSFQNHSINGVSKSSHSSGWSQTGTSGASLGGKLPVSLVNSKLFKPVLPPISKPGISSNNDENKTVGQTPAQPTNPFLHQPAQNPKNPFVQNTHEQGNPVSQPYELNSQSHKIPGATSSTEKPTPRLPPPVSNKPIPRPRQSGSASRMWSSVGPSLAASLDESNITTKPAVTNAYSRHSLTGSDLHTSNSSPDLAERNKSPVLTKPTTPQSSSQAWNRHRPLPPPPSFSPNSDSYTPSQLQPSHPAGLTDPYYSLSPEAQAFADSLTSMGFLRARVARAVVKFGQDEKEVLDHLIAVDALVEKKYAPLMTESALQIYKNDLEKAEKFLQMFSQFEELGFKSDKIQDALVTTNMDHDKALDILTA